MIGVQVVGATTLARKLAAAAARADKVVGDRLDRAGLVVEAQAKRIITQKHIIDTGALRASTYAERVARDQVNISPHVEYALYHELGTYRMAARPFMRPALEESRPTILALLGDDAVQEILWGFEAGGDRAVAEQYVYLPED